VGCVCRENGFTGVEGGEEREREREREREYWETTVNSFIF